jgi:hypothetical protein
VDCLEERERETLAGLIECSEQDWRAGEISLEVDRWEAAQCKISCWP